MLLIGASVPTTFTGCTIIKPVPIAAGQDVVVVNAERAQRSSLDVFKLVTKWEYDNRANLPLEVSRAVDKIRTDFPPAWLQSRQALKDYKEKAGASPSTVQQITAALLTTQNSLLTLKKTSRASDASDALGALADLAKTLQPILSK